MAKSKRWHDRHQQLSTAVNLLTKFPQEVQTIVADGVVLLAEREFKASEVMKSFKSLGTDKVLGLYKSKNKQREYDKNPITHKAVNYIYVLSEENQDYMAKKMLELYATVHEYHQTCKKYSFRPVLADISTLTSTYVEQGPEAAQGFLRTIRQNFERTLLDENPVLQKAEEVRDGSQGMRIRAF